MRLRGMLGPSLPQYHGKFLLTCLKISIIMPFHIPQRRFPFLLTAIFITLWIGRFLLNLSLLEFFIQYNLSGMALSAKASFPPRFKCPKFPTKSILIRLNVPVKPQRLLEVVPLLRPQTRSPSPLVDPTFAQGFSLMILRPMTKVSTAS